MEPSELLHGRYRLVRLIATGGMGSVWEGHDELLDRRVAVKVLSDALAADPTFVERFRREARAAGRLAHPNLARVYDFGDEGHRQFLVMELVEGETLRDRIAREAPLSPGEAVRIAEAVAGGLEAAHGAGVIHRDVKPANIMLDPHGAVKVTDFGIAAAAWGAPITLTGAGLGTAQYASPEQAAGQTVTPASDVYSLGVVTYEMLTGRPPFDAESPVALAVAHARAQPPPVRDLAPAVSAPVAAVVEQALAKDPGARPRSALEFAAKLRTALTDRATTQRLAASTERLFPPSPPRPVAATDVLPRARHRVARWVLVASVLAIAVAALGIVLSGSSHQPSPAPGPTPSPTTQPATIAVPSVAGMQGADAIRALAAAGLSPVNVILVEDDVKPGVVIRTDPPGGSFILPGTSVTLYVEASKHGKGNGND
jgi:serine/threonine-protein kinase